MKLLKVFSEYIQNQAAYTLTAMLNIENLSTFITIMEKVSLKDHTYKLDSLVRAIS